MIGKKSKFTKYQEDGETIQLQNKGKEEEGINIRGDSDKKEHSMGSVHNNTGNRERNKNSEKSGISMECNKSSEEDAPCIEEEEVYLDEEFNPVSTRGKLSPETGETGYNRTRRNKSNQDSKETKEEKEKSTGTTESKIVLFNNQNLKSDTDLLWDEICNGVAGKNSGISMGFNRLNKYLGLRKSIYTTIGAAAGCGKTSLVDCAYVLNPYDWYIKNQYTSKVKFEVLYFSMERKKTYKLAKWLCMKIWKEEQVLITTDELLSWQSTLDKKKQEMAKFYIDYYFKEMIESGIIIIIDGPQNPTGVYKFMKEHALQRGHEIEINQYEKRYIPNYDNLITNVIHDHAGKTKLELVGGKAEKKLTIDKMSEYYCWSRDYLGYSPVMINQFNRTSYADIQFARKEGNDPDPTVEYWKDSGNVIEDVDVAISLFNPYKYSLEEYMGYNVNDFTDPAGNNKFRGLKIIKNSYGTDNLRIGLGFLGEVSLFKELTKSSNISQKELNAVINNDFFL